jgi:DNA-directed RNA polymerase subunit RPC12/RpoP
MPNCYENYEYECAECGGVVKRDYTSLDGKELRCCTYKFVDGKQVPQFKIIYKCVECSHGGEVEDEYYIQRRSKNE